MKITKTSLFSLALVPVIILLSWLLIDGIKSKIELEQQINDSEAAVIEKLQNIRAAQKAHFESKGKYAKDWNALIQFILNDTVYNVSKREDSRPRDKKDPLYSTGTDSVQIIYDTLGAAKAIDAIFPKDKYPTFDPQTIMLIPGLEAEKKEFSMYTAEIFKADLNIWVHVIEVVDPYPMDKSRKEDSENPKRRFLRFGSREEVSLSGNWE